MNLPTGLISQIQSRHIANPRTVLGFFAGVLAILCSSCLIAVSILAYSHTMPNLIPWILGFAALFFVGLVVALFIVMLQAPHKLMLGPVTGTEYAAIHRIALGDSDRGERFEPVMSPMPPPQVGPTPSLPQISGSSVTEPTEDEQ